MISYRQLKRLFDIIGAGIGLLLFAPLFFFLGILIKTETPGPVVVKLPRVSNGRIVHIYKLRSMIDGAHSLKPRLTGLNERMDGPFFKVKDDPRLTNVGKFLRKFRLDEFPQLVNVVKGELTFVGPRPHEPEEVIHYPGEYKHLILAKAGVTGLSQVNGASSLPFIKELQLDSHYLKHQNLWLDTKIVAKTAAVFFFDPTAV